MSCCIFSAVCCVMITSSMSGVALGYNYSLAEYIDTKDILESQTYSRPIVLPSSTTAPLISETNVSVFMKRGVFDDDVHSDMDWRRRGGQPIPPDEDESNLKTAAPEEPKMPLESGRRMDDSILESDAHNKFEGSLMKLTAVPPYVISTEKPVTGDAEMDKAIANFPHGSLEQLKAVQAVINMRKTAANRDTTVTGVEKSTYSYDDRNLAYLPNVPNNPELARRMGSILDGQLPPRPETDLLNWKPGMERAGGIKEPGPTLNPARFAIPSGIQDRYNWEAPKMKPQVYRRVFKTEDDPPPFMKPGTFYTGPIRPTKTTTPQVPEDISDQEPEEKPMQNELDKLEDTLSVKNDKDEIIKEKPPVARTEAIDYYEDENMKGLPVRKKRSIVSNFKIKPNRVKLAEKTMQKDIPGNLIKYKEGKSIFNEITDYPSILLNKLQLSSDDNLNEVSKNEKGKGFKTIKEGLPISNTSTTAGYLEHKVMSLIRSMFS